MRRMKGSMGALIPSVSSTKPAVQNTIIDLTTCTTRVDVTASDNDQTAVFKRPFESSPQNVLGSQVLTDRLCCQQLSACAGQARRQPK